MVKRLFHLHMHKVLCMVLVCAIVLWASPPAHAATAIEYGLIASLIAVVIITALHAVDNSQPTDWALMNDILTGTRGPGPWASGYLGAYQDPSTPNNADGSGTGNLPGTPTGGRASISAAGDVFFSVYGSVENATNNGFDLTYFGGNLGGTTSFNIDNTAQISTTGSNTLAIPIALTGVTPETMNLDVSFVTPTQTVSLGVDVVNDTVSNLFPLFSAKIIRKTDGTYKASYNPVPEPSTIGLLGMGALFVLRRTRRDA